MTSFQMLPGGHVSNLMTGTRPASKTLVARSDFLLPNHDLSFLLLSFSRYCNPCRRSSMTSLCIEDRKCSLLHSSNTFEHIAVAFLMLTGIKLPERACKRSSFFSGMRTSLAFSFPEAFCAVLQGEVVVVLHLRFFFVPKNIGPLVLQTAFQRVFRLAFAQSV